MKFTPPTMIEETKRHVAALLEFCDNKPGADRVDRPGGDEDNVARPYRLATRPDLRSSRHRLPDAIAAESDAD